MLLTACLLLFLTACSRSAQIDTSAWLYYSFEEIGIAMRLPGDPTWDEGETPVFAGSSPDIVVTIRETDELYADMGSLAVRLRAAYRGGDMLCDTAEPGYSEHDTGLALDLCLSVDGVDILNREEMLRYSERWGSVRSRLADYGFILRYPEGGEYDTGHDYAPWHIRYAGVDAARKITERDVTLEEYLGADPAAIDYLVLVNSHTALPDTWEDEVEIVYMTNRHGENIGMERTTYAAYCKLRDALEEEGVHLDINSAYRSAAAQQALVESYLKKYGMDYVDAYVAVPGYSEHHTGLALDLYLESEFTSYEELVLELKSCGVELNM